MAEIDPGRAILFAIAVSALIASALLLALGRGGADRGSPSRPSSLPARSGLTAAGLAARAGPSNERRASLATARAFLPAYLRYEAGEFDSVVARALQASATPEFAAALLGASPRPTGGGRLPAPARLRRFRVRLVPGSPEWGELGGTADRDGHTERLSFVLEHRGHRWLVSGVGE